MRAAVCPSASKEYRLGQFGSQPLGSSNGFTPRADDDFVERHSIIFCAAVGEQPEANGEVDLAEVEIFLRLAERGRLGAGERSAIAVALNRGYALAIDDTRAMYRALEEAEVVGNALTILRTQDIVVELIRGGIVSVEAADAIHIEWAANHRFRLKISSFRDLL